MAATAHKLLEMNDKRIATLQKSLEKKKRALKVQEDMFAQEPKEQLETHPTYLYYQKELQAAEEAYEKKCRYYNDAIEALREKLKTTKPTGKVYRRLLSEVEIEQNEYDALCKAQKAGRGIVHQRQAEEFQMAAIARHKEEAAKEEEERQRKLAEVRARREAERAEEDRKVAERLEEAKKLYASDTNSVVSSVSKTSKISQTPLPPSPPSKLGEYLQRIKEAKTIKDLDTIYNDSKGKFNDEEDALWDERFQALEAEENKPQEQEEAPAAPQESEAFKLLMEMPRAVINSQKGTDLFNSLESPLEMKKVMERMRQLNTQAAPPKAVPLAQQQHTVENSIVGSSPILQTTKIQGKQVGSRLVVRPLGSR